MYLPDECVTIAQAAAYLEMSPYGFLTLVETEGIRTRPRGSGPRVCRADLDAYLERTWINSWR